MDGSAYDSKQASHNGDDIRHENGIVNTPLEKYSPSAILLDAFLLYNQIPEPGLCELEILLMLIGFVSRSPEHSINTADAEGDTALHLACPWDSEVMKQLLEMGGCKESGRRDALALGFEPAVQDVRIGQASSRNRRRSLDRHKRRPRRFELIKDHSQANKLRVLFHSSHMICRWVGHHPPRTRLKATENGIVTRVPGACGN